MFTGIIEEVGTIAAVEKSSDCGVLRVRAQTVLEDIHIGDSIAVNGVCLTVISYNQSGFAADVMHETFLRSALGRLGTRAAGSTWKEPWPPTGVSADILWRDILTVQARYEAYAGMPMQSGIRSAPRRQ